MKLAIICPVGDLNRFGYWRHAQTCLESWQAIGDLFLIHSSRAAIPFSITARSIRTDGTLMKMEAGVERFDHELVAHNANVGLEAARQAGYDYAATICVNWYIESETGAAILHKIQRMIRNGLGYDFLFRRLQISARLFDADRMSPALFDLDRIREDVVKVLVDRIEIGQSTITAARGDYHEMNDEAYIDCEFEITADEMREKLIDVRNYEDILPKRSGADWYFWLRYFQKLSFNLTLSPEPLGDVGKCIAADHPIGALGDHLIDMFHARNQQSVY